MKKNQNGQPHEEISRDRSDYKAYDDYNILEPDPDNDFQYQEDDDDELSDYSLMENASDYYYDL